MFFLFQECFSLLCVLVIQSCLTFCNPVDCSPPGSSVHGILQARILEWVVIPFSRGLPNPGIGPGSPALQADSLLPEPPGKPNAGDPGSIPWSRRSPGEGNGNLLQYFCLGNPMNRGTWWSTVHEVTKSRTRLSN